MSLQHGEIRCTMDACVSQCALDAPDTRTLELVNSTLEREFFFCEPALQDHKVERHLVLRTLRMKKTAEGG